MYATVAFGGGQVSGKQMSGHVMLTVGRGLWTTATAAVGPQCWAMRGVSVIGSRLKSTKLPELRSYIASFQRLTAKTSSSCYVTDAHGDGSSGRAASIIFQF